MQTVQKAKKLGVAINKARKVELQGLPTWQGVKQKSVHEKELNASTNDPKTKPELAKMSKEAAENPEV